MPGKRYKKSAVDSKGRISLPPMRVYPQVKKAIEERAERIGLTPAYYVLRLIAIDLGYLSSDSDPKEIRDWLRNGPEDTLIPVRSVAGRALTRLWGGADVTTSQVAKAAGLSYQQAYRQLTRDPGARRTELGWTLLSLADE